MVLSYTGDDEPVIELTSEEEADFFEALAEIERGEFATDDEIKAVFDRFRA